MCSVTAMRPARFEPYLILHSQSCWSAGLLALWRRADHSHPIPTRMWSAPTAPDGDPPAFPLVRAWVEPPPESNRRPHPYHGTTRNRCADRRSPRSRPTVRAEVIGSLSVKLCVLFQANAEMPGPSHRPRRGHDLGIRSVWERGVAAAIRQGRDRAATPRSRPAPPPPGPSTARGVRNSPPKSTSGNRSRRSRFRRPDAIPRRLLCLE
jgi:hypothetical protein